MAHGGQKLITVILPQGRGLSMLKDLAAREVIRAAFGTARAPFTVVKKKGGISRTESYSVEKDIVQVLVGEEGADEVFAWIYHAAGIGRAHGSFMFQAPVARASEFTLPADLPRD